MRINFNCSLDACNVPKVAPWRHFRLTLRDVLPKMICEKYPCTDSNCALRLRRPTLCPLSYRGERTGFYHIASCRCEFPKGAKPRSVLIMARLLRAEARCPRNDMMLRLRDRTKLHKFPPQLRNDLCVLALFAHFDKLLLLVSQLSTNLVKAR